MKLAVVIATLCLAQVVFPALVKRDADHEHFACSEAPATGNGCEYSCESDGILYKPTQCCGEVCWCVDPSNGHEVPGTTLENGDLFCPAGADSEAKK